MGTGAERAAALLNKKLAASAVVYSGLKEPMPSRQVLRRAAWLHAKREAARVKAEIIAKRKKGSGK